VNAASGEQRFNYGYLVIIFFTDIEIGSNLLLKYDKSLISLGELFKVYWENQVNC